MKIAIFINPQRLTPELKTKLEGTELSEKYGINYDFFSPEPQDLEAAVTKLNQEQYNAILIGGGDGTVRTAAQVLIHSKLPLAILPLGTFNVLAKSLNYPNDIDEMFALIKNKKTKQIDLAEANGKVFVNHAWLGFYYSILKMRKKHKQIFGRSKLLKAIFNTFILFKRLPIYEFIIKTENGENKYRTCLLFVSNNESSNQLLNFGQRPLLSTGLLYVSILNCYSRWHLFSYFLAILFTNFKNSKFVTEFNLDELTVSTKRNEVKIVLDGELFKMENPIHFENHKNILNVIVP